MKLLANKTNVEPVDAVNLYGQLKNDTGSGDGTPADVDLLAVGASFCKIRIGGQRAAR